MNDLNLKLILEAIDRVSAPVRRIAASLQGLVRNSGLDKLSAASRRLGKELSNVKGEAGSLLFQLTALGGGIGYLFKSQLVDTAAKFEQFETVLGTIEGSSEKAKQSMAWVSEFASKTPYELDEVMDSFVRLRSYGLDPTNGLLRTLGDTAAAMGKPIGQAVEAIADAVTGEGERLKEFGIKSAKVGNKIVYEYTANGKTMRKAARSNNRQQIQQVLSSIWNEKYGGAMEKMSTTWKGMVSNLSDQWTQFSKMIMDAGVFAWLKDKLGGILDQIDEMSKSGELARLAEEIGSKILAGLESLWNALPDIWEGIKSIGRGFVWLKDLLGSWQNVAIAAGLVMAGPLLAAIGSLALALVMLGTTLAATPIGWFIAGIAAIAAAAMLIYANWSGISKFFTDLWGQVVSSFESAIDRLRARWEAFVGWVKNIGQAVSAIVPSWVMGGDGAAAADGGARPGFAAARPSAIGPRGRQRDLGAALGESQRMQAEVKVSVEDNRVRVTKIDSTGGDLDAALAAGAYGVAP